MKFKIRRFDGEKSWFDTFEVNPRPHMSVLDALFQIQDEQDSTLAFRYSCRGAVCGSCAMLINRKQRLACRTQVSEISGEKVLGISKYGPLAKPEIKTGKEILVEPLPSLPVIKDLIVDIEQFLRHYEGIEPWFVGGETQPGSETLMSPSDLEKVHSYAGCILCGLCYGACPSFARNRDFIGPAALAKGWRFYADPRSRNRDGIMDSVDATNGIWACDEVYRCVEVCPKQVPPTNAITGFMRETIKHRIRTIFR